MNNRLRGILLLLVGLVLVAVGVAAVYLLTRQGGLSLMTPAPASVDQPTAIPVAKGQVVVVNRDLRLGDKLTDADISVMEVPAETLPRDAITDLAAASGKYIKTDMIQGEMVLEHNLADPTNVSHDLAYILSEDHVLMAISIDDIMTRESIIQRGDLVDIYITYQATAEQTGTFEGETAPGTTTETVPEEQTPEQTGPQTEPTKVPRDFTFAAFQNTNITALVMDIIQPEQDQNLVTQPTPVPAEMEEQSRQNTVIRAYLIALKPQDALVLKHIRDHGAIFDLVLRSPTSTQTFELNPVTSEYIVEMYGLEVLR